LKRWKLERWVGIFVTVRDHDMVLFGILVSGIRDKTLRDPCFRDADFPDGCGNDGKVSGSDNLYSIQKESNPKCY
jgi:hypothetical protein